MVRFSITLLHLFFCVVTLGSGFADELDSWEPPTFGEDRLTRLEISGEEISARRTTQQAWVRYGFTPLNSQTLFHPRESLSGQFLGSWIPALSSTPLHSGQTFVIGNEVGDPLYQELKSQENTSNRTPTIQFHTQTGSEHLSTPLYWQVDASFEQIDHMSSRLAYQRTRRLGTRGPLDSPERAHAWFGENLPTNSFVHLGLQLADSIQEEWALESQYRQGFLWMGVDSVHFPQHLAQERPFQIKQLYTQGHYQMILWEHQSTYARYRYLEDMDSSPQVDSNFSSGEFHQHLFRLGMETEDAGLGQVYVGGLFNNIWEEQWRPHLKDTTLGDTQMQPWLELSLKSQSFHGWQIQSDQTWNQDDYIGTQALQYQWLHNQWSHRGQVAWNYFSRPQILASSQNLSIQSAPTSLDAREWMDYSIINEVFFGVHRLQFHHELYQGFASGEIQDPTYSLKESWSFAINRFPRTRLKTLLSYEHHWGRGWEQMQWTPPKWRFYQNLAFLLPTDLLIQPVYSWTSDSDFKIGTVTHKLSSKHQLHLKLQQSLYEKRLQLWLEMIQLLSEDQVWHPHGGEDRFRVVIGARWGL